MRDLEQLLSIRYELEHTPLSPKQRQTKETSLGHVPPRQQITYPFMSSYSFMSNPWLRVYMGG